MIVIDARHIDEPSNRDEAVALAFLYGLPGDRIVEHSAGCATDHDSGAVCTCVPKWTCVLGGLKA